MLVIRPNSKRQAADAAVNLHVILGDNGEYFSYLRQSALGNRMRSRSYSVTLMDFKPNSRA